MDNLGKEMLITGCTTCPFSDMNDFDCNYSCKLLKFSTNKDSVVNVIKSKKYSPVTPNWCPLKNNNYLFKFKKDEN